MVQLRRLPISGVRSTYSANLVPIEHSDRFLHTTDSLNLCIISTSEGIAHFCLYTLPASTTNVALALIKVPGSPGMIYSFNYASANLLSYTSETITLLASNGEYYGSGVNFQGQTKRILIGTILPYSFSMADLPNLLNFCHHTC